VSGAQRGHKCANPKCNSTFRYWREGRLFPYELREGEELSRCVPDVISEKKPRHATIYFWLCKDCCRQFALQFTVNAGVILMPNSLGRNTDRKSPSQPNRLKKREHRARICVIKLKRIYEPATPSDGVRILVERLWLRGVKKSSARLNQWVKKAAPSADLRRWFHHDSARWDEFKRQYFRELDEDEEKWKPPLMESSGGNVTLIYSSRDSEHNNAVALKEYLDRRQHSHGGNL
jgi:uncharacterized protein YeaO (DUF488 family)